jgi:2'-5' RNA ligase
LSSWVIVAVPREDDHVNKISSEKVAHMTLLFLGENPQIDLDQVSQYIQHTVDTSLTRFGMSVDRRGELGDDEADVLFFDKDWAFKKIQEFRANLLKNVDIFRAYSLTQQYPDWTPHLTLGYPATPAHEDDRDYPTNWVEFDRIALWNDDYDGPEFLIPTQDLSVGMDDSGMWSDEMSEYLEHHGVKGQRWGVRTRADGSKIGRARAKEYSEEAAKTRDIKTKAKASGKSSLTNEELQTAITRMNLEQQFSNLNQRQKNAGQKFAQDVLQDIGKDLVKSTVKDATKFGVNAGLDAAGVKYRVGGKKK